MGVAPSFLLSLPTGTAEGAQQTPAAPPRAAGQTESEVAWAATLAQRLKVDRDSQGTTTMILCFISFTLICGIKQ